MRKLLGMALAVAGMSQAAGCIFTSEDNTTGNIHATWAFTTNGQAADAASACSALGAVKFSVLSTDSTGQGYDDRFPCTDLDGTTGDLPEDTYTVVESLYDASDAAINGTDVTSAGVPVTAGDVTELDLVVYDVQTNVHMRLFVDYGDAGGIGNCETTANGGNGVVQQAIYINDMATGVCLDSIVISGVDQTGAQFSTDACGTPALCMETTVAQEFDIAPGTYTMEVIGYKGATGATVYECYEATADVTMNVDGDIDFPVAWNPPNPTTEANCNLTKPARL